MTSDRGDLNGVNTSALFSLKGLQDGKEGQRKTKEVVRINASKGKKRSKRATTGALCRRKGVKVWTSFRAEREAINKLTRGKGLRESKVSNSTAQKK